MKYRIFCLLFVLISVGNAISAKSFRIATFNIQNFGKSKLAKPEIVDTLAQIVEMFDVVAVQEISDISNQTAFDFLQKINANGARYKMALSPRTGRQIDDKSSAEQYVFYYNSATVALTDTALYDDSHSDYFQREPWTAQFVRKADGFSFIISTIHTMPARAVQEIDALKYVAQWIPRRFKMPTAIIFCGDFNAGCNYASPDELAALDIHKSPWYWVINDDTKTNLSAKSDCAYDRFVVTKSIRDRISKWEVLHAFRSKRVSDHWPVYIELK